MENFSFNIAKTKEEYEGLKNLVEKIFSKEEKELVDDLFYKSPKKDINKYFYAYDKSKNKYVAILCLLEVPVKYGDINIKAAEYGVAGTLEEYQGQGINSKLTKLFLEKSKKLGYNFLIIEGIPYFYRKYGFNYAVAMNKEKLIIKNKEFNIGAKINIRKASLKDIDFLEKENDKSSRIYNLVKYKDRKILKAQIKNYKSEVTAKDYYIIEEKNKKIGYLTLNKGKNNEILDITPDLSFFHYENILGYFKEKGYEEVITDLKEPNKFIKYIKRLGSKNIWNYAYQIKIPDEFLFLNKIKPVLEKRIENSIFANEKINLNYKNFREIIQLKIDKGKIKIDKYKLGEKEGDFALIPQGAVKLFTGDKTINEITYFLDDCYVKDEYRDLVNILFPELKSHFHINY